MEPLLRLALVALVLGVASALGLALWGRWYALRRVRDRLFEELGEEPGGASGAAPPPPRTSVRFPTRYRWLPWTAAALLAALAWILTGWPFPFLVSGGLIVALLGMLVEQSLAARRALKLEAQLADALDIVVAALGAGAGPTAGLQAALVEARAPLAPILAESLARIRYGDDPRSVYRALAHRVPLETFLLFSTTMAVHSEVGGSLAPTLAGVARTIRDRLDIARRIQSNSVQAQLSVAGVTGVTYFIAALMASTNPGQMAEFLASSMAMWLVSGSMLLQAVGIVWMASISRMRY